MPQPNLIIVLLTMSSGFLLTSPAQCLILLFHFYHKAALTPCPLMFAVCLFIRVFVWQAYKGCRQSLENQPNHVFAHSSFQSTRMLFSLRNSYFRILISTRFFFQCLCPSSSLQVYPDESGLVCFSQI